MNDSNRRSFWSSIPGLVTGAAGVLTAIVGLITVLIQLDIIGKDADGGSDDPTVSTSAPGIQPGATTVPGPGAGGTPPRFTVTPVTARLDTLGTKEATIAVRNSGSTASRVEAATLEGNNESEFAVNADGCSGTTVRPDATCTIRVGYAPSARGEHSATLRIEAAGGITVGTVQLTGSRLL